MRTRRLVLLLALAATAGVARGDGSIPDLDGGGLLAPWLAAQNRGDFAAYQALYAKGFTGVRRSGERVVSLDRAGWMADRARMFRRPMVVAASDVDVARGAAGVGIAFTQEFSSGGYHDVGRKVLEWVREDGALRIVHEELLASKLDEQLALLRALYPGYRAASRRLSDEEETHVASFQWNPRSDGGVAGLVHLDGAGGREVELALFDRRGAHPRVVARERFPVAGVDATYDLRPRDPTIAVGDAAVEVVDENEARGDGSITRLTLWRRDGDRLVDVFTTAIDEDGPSCDCYPIRRVAVTTRRRGATWDVVEEITDNADACHGRPRRHQELHRWDGSAYH